MNNDELSFNPTNSGIHRPQSLIQLPIIFALITVFCSIILSTFYYLSYSSLAHDDYISTWYLFNFLGNGVINQIVNYSIFYFCIGFIMCIDQKLHQVTLRNVLFLFVISIINTIVNAFISIGYSQFYLLLREYFYLTYSQISIISPIMGIFASVIKLLILIGLFKLMGSINRNEQQAYVMPQANHRDFFAFLFTTIFCLPSMMILLPLLPSIISGLLYSYIGFNFLDTNLLMTLNALLAPTLLTFFSIAISFIIIYFSVKSCFIREFDTIPLKLLLKAVGWAYLYLILFNIVINIIYFIISFSIVSSMHSYSLVPTAMMLVMLLSVVFVVASIVGMVMFTRKAVRKYFSQYSAI